jgi:hypothetical protein
MAAKDAQKRECNARCGTEMRQGEAIKWGIILKSILSYRNRLVLTPRCQGDFNPVQLDQNSLADEMRTRGNERVSVRQGYDYGCRYGTLNEANLLKTARTCCSLEA